MHPALHWSDLLALCALGSTALMRLAGTMRDRSAIRRRLRRADDAAAVELHERIARLAAACVDEAGHARRGWLESRLASARSRHLAIARGCYGAWLQLIAQVSPETAARRRREHRVFSKAQYHADAAEQADEVLGLFSRTRRRRLRRGGKLSSKVYAMWRTTMHSAAVTTLRGEPDEYDDSPAGDTRLAPLGAHGGVGALRSGGSGSAPILADDVSERLIAALCAGRPDERQPGAPMRPLGVPEPDLGFPALDPLDGPDETPRPPWGHSHAVGTGARVTTHS